MPPCACKNIFYRYLHENRIGYKGEPLGDYAWRLIAHIMTTHSLLLLTETIIKELERTYPIEQVNGIFIVLKKLLRTHIITQEQRDEATAIAHERNVPVGDAIHAVVARDTRSTLVTRDKHFRKLNDIAQSYTPEELT